MGLCFRKMRIGLVAAAVLSGTALIASPSPGLTKKEQARELMQKALQALEYENHMLAWDYFREISELGIELPSVFHYHYGVLLVNVSDIEGAAVELQIYLEREGDSGKYADKAKAKLKEIEDIFDFWADPPEE